MSTNLLLMQYKEYYQSALRHLYVCKTMMELLDSMDRKQHLFVKRERLKLDIYYLSGYVIETMISYTFFVRLNWQKNKDIKSCPYYEKGFKTHDLSRKLSFAASNAHCDYSGVPLLGNKISDSKVKKMFCGWSEVIRYQNPKTCMNLDFSEDDLKNYLSDIELMVNRLKIKYFS